MEHISETRRDESELSHEPASMENDQDLRDKPMPLADIADVKVATRRILRSSRRETPNNTNVSPQEKKRTYSAAFDELNPEKYYLSVNKKLKRSAHINLETIYEEPVENIDNFKPIGARKISRAITFPNQPLNKANKTKTKKRMAKVKKHFVTKRKATKVSHAQFKNKLESLQEMLD